MTSPCINIKQNTVCSLPASQLYTSQLDHDQGGNFFVRKSSTSCNRSKSTLFTLPAYYLSILATYFNMLAHLELIALIIVALSATHKFTASASSTSSRNLRGPDVDVELKEDSLTADIIIDVEKEEEDERHLSVVAPEDPSYRDGTPAPTPTPIPAKCNGCGADNKVCAREWPGADAQCYPRCPKDNTCNGNGINALCVSSTFNCGGYAGVLDVVCQCDKSSNLYVCWPSECGLDGPV
jgi:hypothetical protein